MLNTLIGEVLTHVDDVGNDEILLRTESGREILIHHRQGCCESVRIVDTEGNWHDLIGKVITEAKEDISPYEEAYDSGTKTNLTFRVNDATVISKWIGESNGWYSESVDIEEITKRGS